MRSTSVGLSFAVVAAVAMGLGCKKPPAPSVEPLSAAESDAGPRRIGGRWERLATFTSPGRLTRISRSRLRIDARRPSAGGAEGDVVIIVDAAGKVLSTRAREPNAVADSFDGRLQFIATATGFERLDVDSGKRTPWTGTAPGAISDDLRLVVGTHDGKSGHEIDIDDIATGKRACNVAMPFAGGGPWGFSFVGGGRFVTAGNHRGEYYLDLSSCGLRGKSQCSGMSDDGRIVVEFPCQGYMRPWTDSFVVVDPKTGAEQRKLSLNVPRDDPQHDAPNLEAVLTPKGDRVFVLFDRQLIELRVSDGKETHRESVDDLLSKSPWPRPTVMASDDVLVIESDGKATPFSFPATP